MIDYNVNGFRHIAELSNIHVLNNFDNSQHAIFINSVVYQSSENRAVLLRGCVSLWSVQGAFAELKQLAISTRKNGIHKLKCFTHAPMKLLRIS